LLDTFTFLAPQLDEGAITGDEVTVGTSFVELFIAVLVAFTDGGIVGPTRTRLLVGLIAVGLLLTGLLTGLLTRLLTHVGLLLTGLLARLLTRLLTHVGLLLTGLLTCLLTRVALGLLLCGLEGLQGLLELLSRLLLILSRLSRLALLKLLGSLLKLLLSLLQLVLDGHRSIRLGLLQSSLGCVVRLLRLLQGPGRFEQLLLPLG